MKKKHPLFRTTEEAALFWESHEILDHVDANEFKVVKPATNKKHAFKNPRPKSAKQLVSIRVDAGLVQKAKTAAARKRIGYITVLRNWMEKGAS